MLDKPPMDYKRAMGFADEVVRSFNAKHDRLWNKTDPYSSYSQAQAYKSERDKLNTEVRRLKTEVFTLSKSLKGSIRHRGGKDTTYEEEQGGGQCLL